MSFPTIPTVAAGRVLTTNQLDTTGTRTFPSLTGLTKNAGDLLIAIIVTYQSTTNPQFSSWGGGFTEFHDSGTSTTLGIGCAYKWSDGTETGTFSVTQATTITGDASMILLSIPSAHPTTPPEAGSRADGTSAAADPGSFDPSGWGTEDTLWISLVGSGLTNISGAWTATGTTAPTSYTDRVDTNASDTSTIGDCEAAVAFRQLNAGSTDVGTAGVDTSNARNSALVIAVRGPAVVTTTHTTDAAIKALGTLKTHTTDSIVLKTTTKTHTTDALLEAPATTETETHTTDAVLKKTQVVTHTTDALVLKTQTRTHTTDGVLRKTATAIHTTDAVLKATQTRTHTTDAVLKKTQTKVHTTDGVLKATSTRTHTTDSVLRATQTKAHTTNAIVTTGAAIVELEHSTDAVLKVVFARTHTADAVLKATLTQVHSTDAALKATLVQTHTTNAVVTTGGATVIAEHSTDALVVQIQAVTHTTDANLSASSTVSHGALAIIGTEVAKQLTSDRGVRELESVERQ